MIQVWGSSKELKHGFRCGVMKSRFAILGKVSTRWFWARGWPLWPDQRITVGERDPGRIWAASSTSSWRHHVHGTEH